MHLPAPRSVTSVLVEEGADSVTVTWGLGEVVEGPVEYFSYELYYFGLDGNGGKRFGARFGEKATAYVFENTSSTQANYDGDCISLEADRMVVHYRDASLGLSHLGTLKAETHVNGDQVQADLPVTLLN